MTLPSDGDTRNHSGLFLHDQLCSCYCWVVYAYLLPCFLFFFISSSTFMLGSIIYQQEGIFSCYNSCTSLPTLCWRYLWMVWQLVHDVHIFHNSTLGDVGQARHNIQSTCNSYKEHFQALKVDCLTANLL